MNINPKPTPSEVKDFMAKNPHMYSDFAEWVERSFREIQTEQKFCRRKNEYSYIREIAAVYSDSQIIGSAMYKLIPVRKPGIPLRSMCEIKNITVDPNYRRNGIGSMLLQHILDLDKEAPYPGLFVADTPAFNTGAVSFFESNGFQVSGKEALYTSRMEFTMNQYKRIA